MIPGKGSRQGLSHSVVSRGLIFISATTVGLHFYPYGDLVTHSYAQAEYALPAPRDFVPCSGGFHVGEVCTARSARQGGMPVGGPESGSPAALGFGL